MNTTGFIRTFIAVCSGTEVFPALVKRSFFRAVWHLILLAIICGGINLALRLYPFNKAFEESCTNLSKRFGKIEYTEKGIVPSINPEKARSASSNDFLVDYLLNSEALKNYIPNKKFNRGIVWTPTTVLLWQRPADVENCIILPLLIPPPWTTSVKQGNPSELLAKVLTLYKHATRSESDFNRFYDYSVIYALPFAKNKKVIQFREFHTNVLFWIPMTFPVMYAIFLFLYIFMNSLIMVPVYILFFTSFSYFFGRSSMMNMKFSELYISGIYTGFPGIVIATLYTALGLPLMDFPNIFLISYFVYSFAVFNRFRKDEDSNKTTS